MTSFSEQNTRLVVMLLHHLTTRPHASSRFTMAETAQALS
jgi:hypothetical protein